MPKDEFDFDDPMELNGMAFATDEDTTSAMCECFIEEFMRMGYTPPRLLALFRNPHYIGMNMVLEKRGEAFVRQAVEETFARWGRPCAWANGDAPRARHGRSAGLPTEPLPPQSVPSISNLTDPMGNAIPKLDL
jgi:hypothetical protein